MNNSKKTFPRVQVVDLDREAEKGATEVALLAQVDFAFAPNAAKKFLISRESNALP